MDNISVNSKHVANDQFFSEDLDKQEKEKDNYEAFCHL